MNNEDSKEKNVRAEVFSWIKYIIAAALFALIINKGFVVNAEVGSGSMENTIMTYDRILANRLAYISDQPQRFDVIALKNPDNEKEIYIKRIIGLPGELVTIMDGKVYIDNSETPLDDTGFLKEDMYENFGSYEVPDNCYFVMGDNRNDSWDSRCFKNTYVRRDQIIGKVFASYFPKPRMIK